MTQADNNATIKPQATSHKPQATSHNSALISIIIPAYNTAPYIHRAIGSSLRQTHKNIEIIIVDDGSTDDTLRVANYFAGTDSRIRVFTQKNAGVSAARNHGIDKAKGEYIYFLDSDDWLEDDAIELLLNAQSEHPDELICANQCWEVTIKGDTFLRNGGKGKSASSCTLGLKEIAETYAHLRGPDVFHSASAKLFRTPFSARFPEGITHSEDAVFFMRYLLQSSRKAYYVSKPIVNVLDREGSAIRSGYKPTVFDSQTAAYDILIDLMNDEYFKKLMLMSYSHFAYNCFFDAVKYHADIGEIKRIKSALRESAWLTVKCRRLPRAMRLKTFLAAYAPVPVFKAFFSMWNILKLLRGKKKPDMEIITNWQDFPKAPEI